MLVLAAVASPAQADDRAAAREEFKTGARYFEIGDYPQALQHFKNAYLNFEDPAILFNIAQCERLLNHKQEALRSYRIYLAKKPSSPNREEIEKIIVTLEDAIKKDNAAVTLPPVGVESATKPEPKIAPPASPPPATSPPLSAPAETAPAATSATVERAPRPPGPPLYKRWWLWTAAGAVVVAAIAVGVGVGVAGSSHPDFKPTQPDVGPGATAARLVLTVRF